MPTPRWASAPMIRLSNSVARSNQVSASRKTSGKHMINEGMAFPVDGPAAEFYRLEAEDSLAQAKAK
jgi:hypothetical protein